MPRCLLQMFTVWGVKTNLKLHLKRESHNIASVPSKQGCQECQYIPAVPTTLKYACKCLNFLKLWQDDNHNNSFINSMGGLREGGGCYQGWGCTRNIYIFSFFYEGSSYSVLHKQDTCSQGSSPHELHCTTFLRPNTALWFIVKVLLVEKKLQRY